MKQTRTLPSKILYAWRGKKGAKRKERFRSFTQTFLGSDPQTLLDNYGESLQYSIKHRGKLETVRIFKQIYNVALRYAAGLQFERVGWLKADRDNFPKVIKTFRKYLLGTHSEKRMALSVLQLYKVVNCEAKYSTRSITDPYSGSHEPFFLSDFRSTLEQMFPSEEQGQRIRQLEKMHGLHISAKNGPNGPMLLNAAYDREAIRDTKLEENIIELSKVLKNSELNRIFEVTSTRPQSRPHSKTRKLSHSRIRIKNEPGGKARVFCIVDFFSQACLLPIHKFLMKKLAQLPQDGTNDHAKAAKTVQYWTDGRYGNCIYSHDLTNATDRFPRFLQEIVLAQLFGEEIAHLWTEVISNRDFDTPSDRSTVRFNAGQPLGALSSWAAFALTHHVFVRTAYRLCNDSRLRYRIIGDDIAMAGSDAVAAMYERMMSDIHVPLSKIKGCSPEQMSSGPVAELAKRLFNNGVEITPIPPDAILEMWRNPLGKRQLIEMASDRGYVTANQVYPVQSSLTSQSDWFLLTFPIGNRLSQDIKSAIKLCERHWEDRDDTPPFGMNPNWMFWSHIEEAAIARVVKKHLLLEIKRGVKDRSDEIDQLEKLLDPSVPTPYQGGDWQPEPWKCHPSLIPQALAYMVNRLTNTWMDLEMESYFDEADPYRVIASLHTFLGPEPVFLRKDYRDEKKKTRVFLSNLVVKLSGRILAQDFEDRLMKDLEIERSKARLKPDFVQLMKEING
jgi:hypothetical protein